MQIFDVHPMTSDEARLAYPLVREAEPAVQLDAWLGFARRTARAAAGRSGIMVATREGQRFPSGLFCYRCHDDLALGSVMTADYFVAVDILDPTPVVGAMVRELESLGERLKCDAVRSIVHTRAERLSHCLERSGHRLEATNFVKLLAEKAALPAM
jgi:hypothetical protein